MKHIFLILASISFNASAQLLMRRGMLQIGEITISGMFSAGLFLRLVSNVFLWLSFLCYGTSILLWIVVLSGVEVSYAYAFSSLGFVLVAIMGAVFLKEQVSVIRIAGILIICFGVVLVARS
jgi:multidrug transporter EmrE-like cation transporter